MAVQCGICKNVMPSSSFLSHKERKHSTEQRVPFIKLPDNVLNSNGTANGQLIKCRHCPNRIPEHAMERHLQRSHFECHLCGKVLPMLGSIIEALLKTHYFETLLLINLLLLSFLTGKILQKSNHKQHMQQKHGTNLMATSNLTQSKSSIYSDSDLASTISSTYDPSPIPYRPPPTPSPVLASTQSKTSANALLSAPLKTNNKPDVIRVNEFELHKYIRQGRVYTKNGCLYLRNGLF